MISGSPVSSRPISARLVTAVSTGALTLLPAALAVSWTIPAQNFGPATLTPAVIAVSWTVPTQSLGFITEAGVATGVWTAPNQAITGSGTASLSPAVVIVAWTLPSQSLTVSGTLSGSAATATWTLPAQSLVVGDNPATLTPAAIAVSWVIPTQIVSGPTHLSSTRLFLVPNRRNTGGIGLRAGDLVLKDPDSTEPYGLNWEDWLADLGADVILSDSTWTVSPDDDTLTLIDGGLIAGALSTQVRIADGILGHRYTVTNHIVTSDGNVDERSFKVLVQER